MRTMGTKRGALFVVLSVFLMVVAALPATTAAQKGRAPQCQEECLTKHSARMGLLKEEYEKTDNKLKYQDSVEDEAAAYRRCLDNCREVIPVK